MYDTQYPDEGPLLPSPDLGLLCHNGGPLSDEEFDSGAHVYQRTQNMVSVKNPITTRHVQVLYDKIPISL